ncbi:hypothetical protein K227x_39730 [Rubripirellula lacrimiformis]|uniref:Uncharacterized protein n=1 Tax=Rubripirellula lacrimiformis TaxID=1930273 RepID=A0A517NEL7_9BACT|nr:hypothetical protein K227x_39730 [Rubripirellula lacrimiformis]
MVDQAGTATGCRLLQMQSKLHLPKIRGRGEAGETREKGTQASSSPPLPRGRCEWSSRLSWGRGVGVRGRKGGTGRLAAGLGTTCAGGVDRHGVLAPSPPTPLPQILGKLHLPKIRGRGEAGETRENGRRDKRASFF